MKTPIVCCEYESCDNKVWNNPKYEFNAIIPRFITI